MRVTIKDIALAAGVSYSTVSKALNDSPLVTAKTKARVVSIAEEMGYEPNLAAQQLVSKQSKTIGLIWPTLERVAPSTLVTEINNEISQRGYSMILSINSIKNSLDMFKRFQVDGVIVFDEHSEERIEDFSFSLPIVSYGVIKDQGFPIIDVNYQEAMHQAVEYLYTLGHRKIAFVGDFSPIDDRQIEKYKGFKKAMTSFGLATNGSNLINTAGLDWFDGYTATKKLIHSTCLPTAIIGASYDISAGIVRAIRETNLIIPKDISIIGYDNIPQMANLEIPLTSFGVPIELLATKIVQTLFDYMQGKKLDPSVQKLTPSLFERNSCAQANHLR